MSSFTTELVISPAARTGFWKLDEAFDYYIDESARRVTISVPKGFETDFASIPRIFWNILPPFGTYGKASIVHDFLYSVLSNDLQYTRADCDKVFLDAMGILGTNVIVRYSMWVAVRSFGWMFFKLPLKNKEISTDKAIPTIKIENRVIGAKFL